MTRSASGGAFGRMVSVAAPLVPGPVVKALASPYIAGSRLEDAVRTVKSLNRAGLCATVDILGESVEDESRNDMTVSDYKALLEAITADRLDANVSLKPSAFGSTTNWDASEAAITAILTHAAELGVFVRIDMEDATTTDATLALYRRLRSTGYKGTGVVLQSRLWRSLGDVQALADLTPNVRLCKGIYLEKPGVGLQDYDAIRVSFCEMLRRLLSRGSYVGIATHDEYLIVEALRAVSELGLSPDAYEFQMLLGVRGDLARTLAREHRVRIYVPYGSDAAAYSQRRMRENPAMAGLVGHAVMRKLIRRNGAGLAAHCDDSAKHDGLYVGSPSR